MKRGPKTDPMLGPLRRMTLFLDELTITQLGVIGKNVSDGARKAARVAFDRYQRTPDEPALSSGTTTATPDVPDRAA